MIGRLPRHGPDLSHPLFLAAVCGPQSQGVFKSADPLRCLVQEDCPVGSTCTNNACQLDAPCATDENCPYGRLCSMPPSE